MEVLCRTLAFPILLLCLVAKPGGGNGQADAADGPAQAGRRRRQTAPNFRYGLTNAEIKVILGVHNWKRSMVMPGAADMLYMTWSDSLARKAQLYTCRCRSDHSSSEDRTSAEFGVVGENIWIGTNWGPASALGAVSAWFNEASHYDFSSLTCTPNKICGHYTQGVWATSAVIGCGLTQCDGFSPEIHFDSGFVFICHYAPGGNYRNTPPYTRGSACSSCPAEYLAGCVDNLCTPTETCLGLNCADGTIPAAVNQCVCSCSLGVVGATCSSTLTEQQNVCADVQPGTIPPSSEGVNLGLPGPVGVAMVTATSLLAARIMVP